MDERKVPKLIEEVHARPILWDRTSDAYKNKINKGQEWSKVATILNVAKTCAQNKWKSLIKTFKSEHNRVHLHKSGDGLDEVYESSWPYYASLTFISNSVIPNSSSGNLDIPEKLSLLDTSSTESNIKTVSPISAVPTKVTVPMSGKSVITEQLLQMANEKKALIEKSLTHSQEVDNTAESDKMNRAFFQTLLPELRLVDRNKILLCRSDISRVVQSYAYTGSTWKSISDKNEKVTEKSTVTVKKRFSSRLKRRLFEDDDDCQIVEKSPPPPPVPYQPNLAIKKEVKHEPTWEKLDFERPRIVRRSNEIAIPSYGCNNYVRAYNPPWKYNNYNYNEQYPFEYPGQHNFVASARHNRYSDDGRQCMPSNVYPPVNYTPEIAENTFHHSRYPFCGNVDQVSGLYNNHPPTSQSAASGQPANIGRTTIRVDRPIAQLSNSRNAGEIPSSEENRLTGNVNSANVTESSTNIPVANQVQNEVSYECNVTET